MTPVLKKSDDPTTHIIASVSTLSGDRQRIAALCKSNVEWNGGVAAWVRGTSSNSYKKGERLLEPDNSNDYFIGEILMRYTLSKFGYDISFTK